MHVLMLGLLPCCEYMGAYNAGGLGSIDVGGRRVAGYVSDIPIPDLTFMLPAHVRAAQQ